MKFEIQDVFSAIAPTEYEALYFDEAFNDALGDALHMARKLLRLERSANKIVRHVCFEPRREAGSPADEAFGKSRASFVEELEYDAGARRGTWRTIPNLFTERVRNAGTIELAADGDGTRRVVCGEVRVSLFGFGRIVEKMIVAEIEKNYVATTSFTREYLTRAR